MSALASAVYVGRVTHSRRGPRHRFAYPLHMFYLDLDEVPGLARGPFRIGTFGWLSYCRDDYFGDRRVPLKQAVLDRVEAELGVRPDGPVRLLTQVRSFGYVFNPVSFYYCYGADGVTLEAVLAEITNTPWRERHAYVLPTVEGQVRSDFEKQFHVSPFFGMTQRYHWYLSRPAEDLAVTMVNTEGGKAEFSATLGLKRRDFTTRAVWRVALAQPLMAWAVHVRIYIQAFRLWRKQARYFEHPAQAVAAGRRKA